MKEELASVLTQDMINILECLLNNEERKCDTCKKCDDVDVCCFLTDAVIVYKHRRRKKPDQAV